MMLRKWMYAALAVPLAVAMGFAGVSLAKQRTDKTDATMMTVPAGTALEVKLDQSVSTKYDRSGERFRATLLAPVRVDNQVVIPDGTPVEGRVVYAHPSGRLKGRAYLELTLVSLDLNQEPYELRTSAIGRASGNHKLRDIGWIGGGGGTGALIGALAAGGEGAAIGGPVGAGAGLTVAVLTGKKQVTIPAETPLTFRLTRPLSLPPNRGGSSNRS